MTPDRLRALQGTAGNAAAHSATNQERRREIDAAMAADDWRTAYAVLNPLSLADIATVVGMLPAKRRTDLEQNLNTVDGIDRSRIYLGIQEARSGSAWWSERAENVHAAIRSGNLAGYPDGAYWQLNGLNVDDIGKLMRFLDRDHLDELIAHQDEGLQVPTITQIVAAASKARAHRGATSVEAQIKELAEAATKHPGRTEANAQASFRLLRGLDDLAVTRLARSNRTVFTFLSTNQRYADGIEDPARLQRLFGTGRTDELDVTLDPDAAGLQGEFTDARRSPRYLDRQVIAVAYSIYIGGFLVFLKGSPRPILVPEEYVNFDVQPAGPSSETVFGTLAAAQQSVTRPGTYAYYEGAGGLVVAPTMLSFGNAPRTVRMAQEAVLELKNEVQTELTWQAIMIASASAVGVAAGIGKSTGSRLKQSVRAEDYAEALANARAGGRAAAEAEAATPAGAELTPVPNIPFEDMTPAQRAATARTGSRPQATPRQLDEALANEENFFVFRCPSKQIAATKEIVFTGENTPPGTAKKIDYRVTLVRPTGPGFYGDYGVLVRGSDSFKPTTNPSTDNEFLIRNIEPDEGVYFTRAELEAAKARRRGR